MFAAAAVAYGQNDRAYVDAQLTEIASELRALQITEYLIRKDYCEGNIRIFKMPNGSMCASASTYYSAYVIWKNENSTWVKKVDNCGAFDKIPVEELSLFEKVANLKHQLQKDDVKPYESEAPDPAPFGNMEVKDCWKEFTFHLNDLAFTKKYKEYDLEEGTRFPNVNAHYNNNLPLVQLDEDITRLVSDMESKGKFRRN